MADIYYFPNEDSDEGEGDLYEDTDDGEGGYNQRESMPNPDDLLPPIEKLVKYANSDNVFNRQFIARTILDTLRVVTDVPEDVEAVLNVMNVLAEDAEPSVRAELMEQVPHIAMSCQEFKARLAHVVPSILLPMVVKFLKDIDIQVRKTSQAALLVLLEQGLVEKDDVKEQVCPVILGLTEAKSVADDYRTEAVALLSKMAPLIGKEMTEAIFLERFATLCTDPLFHIRKVCAANFGDFSSVVGLEATEQVLLPKFFYLCEDGVWGVRKACADVFMPVSCVCSPSVRKTELSPIFVNLLKDQSRWVKMTAYQALGPFISTFADANITALLHNDNGEIVITDRDLLASRLDDLEIARAEEQKQHVEKQQQQQQQRECGDEVQAVADDDSMMDVAEDEHLEDAGAKKLMMAHSRSEGDLSLEEERAKAYNNDNNNSSSLATSESYNNFLYWRDPVPVLEGLDEAKSADVPKADDNDKDSSDASTMELFRPAEQQKTSFSVFDPNVSQNNLNNNINKQQEPAQVQPQNMQDPALPKGPPATIQSIVPQPLIDYFVSMTDPSRAQTVDSDIAHHCAFSLPAVALTLGRSNWPLLKETYAALASEMQWKVRRTLASSIHELGVILGQDAIQTDLIPIFDGFLKDLDEVRIGLLKHLADFLRLLPPDVRREYLPRLSDFLYMDNDRNWRFRQELTEQLGQLVPLCSPEEVKKYLAPIAVLLIKDKVSAVRLGAVSVHSIIIKTLLEDSQSSGIVRVLLADLVGELVRNELWIHRQTYASLALQLYEGQALDHAQYAQDVLPNILELSEDKVPNVRLVVARALKLLKQTTYFIKEANPHHERMERVMTELSGDTDPDVRAFFQDAHMYDSDGEPIVDISSLPV